MYLDPNDPRTQLSLQDILKGVGVGTARGIAKAPGGFGDAANAAQYAYGTMTGNQGIQDQASRGMRGENGFDMGTSAMSNLLDKIGVSYQPTTDYGQDAYDTSQQVGQTVGALSGGRLLKAAAGRAPGIMKAINESAGLPPEVAAASREPYFLSFGPDAPMPSAAGSGMRAATQDEMAALHQALSAQLQ